MEQLHFSYQGQASIDKIVRVGNVGSGDLEILLEPTDTPDITIDIITSVDNRSDIWRAIFNRHFSAEHTAMRITINDFGATPGVIGLRLTQALEHLTEAPLKPALTRETAPAAQSPEIAGLLKNHSFIEMGARERARFLLDDGSFREIIGSEYHSFSPWLLPQGIVPQTDDGCVVAKGMIDGRPAVVIGIDGTFQGGAIGEISGAKMASALELALQDAQQGHPIQVVLLLETGGVRLQEANLGLAAIADIHAGIVALRQYVPVIGVIAGTVGCFGGMSIAAGLCSKLILTQEARLGLNGPQVIEQEAGILEYDSRNRPFIWSVTGGEQRYATGFADYYADDDAEQIRATITQIIHPTADPVSVYSEPVHSEPVRCEPVRCEQIDHYLRIFNQMDTTQQSTPELTRQYFAKGEFNV